MKIYLFVFIIILISCSGNLSKLNNPGKSDKCTEYDTVCNFEICRGKHYIILNDSMKLKPDEKAFAVVQLKNDSNGTIMGWNLNLFRIYKNDSIRSNYPRFSGFEIPKNMDIYLKLIDSYIKTVKLYPVKLKNELEPNCSIAISIIFKNSDELR